MHCRTWVNPSEEKASIFQNNTAWWCFKNLEEKMKKGLNFFYLAIWGKLKGVEETVSVPEQSWLALEEERLLK